jgi:hypothetical protein
MGLLRVFRDTRNRAKGKAGPLYLIHRNKVLAGVPCQHGKGEPTNGQKENPRKRF